MSVSALSDEKVTDNRSRAKTLDWDFAGKTIPAHAGQYNFIPHAPNKMQRYGIEATNHSFPAER
ncbi:MAG: hypothetical protein Q8P44_01060 [Dehalococcoidia bacterium]|nr:hypothetical protein [Dehalococcoidia bacterium]